MARGCAASRPELRRCARFATKAARRPLTGACAGVLRASTACECRHDQGRTLAGVFARRSSTDSQPTSDAAGASDGARPGSTRPADEGEPVSRLLEHSLPYVKTLVRRHACCAPQSMCSLPANWRRGGRTTLFAQERSRLVYRPRRLVRRAWRAAVGFAAADVATKTGLLPRGPAQLVEHFTTVCDHAFLEMLERKQDEFAGAKALMSPAGRTSDLARAHRDAHAAPHCSRGPHALRAATTVHHVVVAGAEPSGALGMRGCTVVTGTELAGFAGATAERRGRAAATRRVGGRDLARRRYVARCKPAASWLKAQLAR